MANAHDVAAYVLAKLGETPTSRLHKLLYYCQGWHLAWDEQPLFDEQIEAWPPGPVLPALRHAHHGMFRLSGWPLGDPTVLDDEERETVDAVLDAYGPLPADQLAHLVRSERPWRDARAGLGAMELVKPEIPPESMQDYYTAVDAAENATPVSELDWAAGQ